MISNDPRGCPGESDPFAPAEHDIDVLVVASAIRTWLESHPELEREPGWALILSDLSKATGAELSRLHRLGLIGYAPGTYTAEVKSKPRITPLGEQVRDYLEARRG